MIIKRNKVKKHRLSPNVNTLVLEDIVTKCQSTEWFDALNCPQSTYFFLFTGENVKLLARAEKTDHEIEMMLRQTKQMLCVTIFSRLFF